MHVSGWAAAVWTIFCAGGQDMRGNETAISTAETTTTAAGTLPHLKGARPTIHAGLLRPVLLNR